MFTLRHCVRYIIIIYYEYMERNLINKMYFNMLVIKQNVIYEVTYASNVRLVKFVK